MYELNNNHQIQTTNNALKWLNFHNFSFIHSIVIIIIIQYATIAKVENGIHAIHAKSWLKTDEQEKVLFMSQKLEFSCHFLMAYAQLVR